MAVRMSRKTRRLMTQVDQHNSRMENGIRKRKERSRRLVALKGLLQKGKFPYTPAVMSWLSAQLDKPTRQITPNDVEAFLKA